MEGVAVDIRGFPARFCVARAALNTVLTHTVSTGTNGLTLVIEGVDASATLTGVGASAWISLGSPGNKCFFMSRTFDPLQDHEAVWGSWRGSLPIYNADSIEFGIEAAFLCDLAINAWGIWLPHDLSITL